MLDYSYRTLSHVMLWAFVSIGVSVNIYLTYQQHQMNERAIQELAVLHSKLDSQSALIEAMLRQQLKDANRDR